MDIYWEDDAVCALVSVKQNLYGVVDPIQLNELPRDTGTQFDIGWAKLGKKNYRLIMNPFKANNLSKE